MCILYPEIVWIQLKPDKFIMKSSSEHPLSDIVNVRGNTLTRSSQPYYSLVLNLHWIQSPITYCIIDIFIER